MMKLSCGKGREKNIFSAKRKGIAVLLGMLPFVCALSLFPAVLAGNLPPERPYEIWQRGSFVNITSQNLVIGPGETLIIEPGVKVSLGSNLGIDVRGSLTALGTADEPIQFTSKSYLVPWRSLMFIEDEGSVLKHAIIKEAENGLHISSSSPRVENVQIFGVVESAVVVDTHTGSNSAPVFVNSSLIGGLSGLDLVISGDSWVRALNTSFDDNRIHVGDFNSSLERQWFLDVRVDNTLGESLNGSLVTVEDEGQRTFSELTDSEGISSFVVTEYIKQWYFPNAYHTPHNISVSKPGYDEVTLGPIWLNGNAVPEITLEDTTSPMTTLVVGDPHWNTNLTFIGVSTMISLETDDEGTLPIHTEYLIDQGDFITYTAPFLVEGDEGSHSIAYRSTDTAGNRESTKFYDVYLDTRPPRLSFSLDPVGEGVNPIRISPGTAIALGATDQGSGVSRIEYSTDGSPPILYTSPMTLPLEGDYNISFNAYDNIGISADGTLWLRVVAPPPVNNAPYFVSIPEVNAKVGEDYNYQANAQDVDTDILTYSLVELPYGMTIDSSTGLVTWIPDHDQKGENRVTIVVSDGKDTDAQTFYIMVEAEDVKPADSLLLILGSIGILLGVGTSFIGITEYGRYRFFLFFLVPLYSKLRKEEVLNQFLRGQIYGYIMAYPGENYSSIKRAMNVGNGTLTHHLYILEREGFVSSRVDGRYKRFYPTGLALKRRPPAKTSMIQKAILKMIEQNPNISQKEIALSLETSKQVVNYHIKVLEKQGMISVDRNRSELKYEILSRRRAS